MLLQLCHAARQLAPSGARQLHSTSAAVWGCLRHGTANASQAVCSSEQQAVSSWREKLIALSSLTIYAQGHLKQFAASPSGLATSSAASLAAAAAAAAATAAPAGAVLALSSPGNYWLKQAGLAGQDRNVTHGLIAANIGCFGLQLLNPQFTQMFVRIGYKVAAGEYWRLLTAAFCHGNIIHVGVNMLALYNIGHAIEGALGSSRYLAVYLGSALCGNMVGYMMGHGCVSSMGASGALCGLFGGYLVHRWVNRRVMPLSRPELMSIATTLGLNLVIMTAFSGAMDQWAHIGGFVGGAAITLLIGPKYRY